MSDPDYSTIDLGKLHKRPTYEERSGRRGTTVSRTMGQGCAGDPPGFPSYFLRAIYTSAGNNPSSGPETVITHAGTHYVVAVAEWRTGEDYEARRARFNRLLRSLWIAPAFDSVRAQAWIRDSYRHMAHCYRDDDGIATEPSDRKMLISPVPSYKLRSFTDDPRFSESWRMAERTAIAEFNADVRARVARVAIPANHSAHRRVVEFYPDAAPRLDLIAAPPRDVEGQWWETEATCPTPEACAPRSCGPHPVNGSWCQWCGWRDPDHVSRAEATP